MANINLKTNKQINEMNKASVAKYAISITEGYKNLHYQLFDPNNGEIPKLKNQYTSVSNQLSLALNTNQFLIKKITELEKQCNSNSQYSRKETIEFHGFDASLEPGMVEKKVLDVINQINDHNMCEEYTTKDIQACHKLKDPTKIICRFVSRKKMRNVINQRKKLKGADLKSHGVKGKLFINESMAPAFKSIDWKCRQLQKAKAIKDCWFFNGNYNIILSEGGEKIRILHTEDILDNLNINEEDLNKICSEWKDKRAERKFTKNTPNSK